MMRKMVVAYDYVRRVVQGDLPVEDDESSEEYDDTELDDEDDSRSE